MGLHPDVKKFLCARHPECVSTAVPDVACEVQICDAMWLLFKYFPDEDATGDDLLRFFWNPIERFYAHGGTTYVCVFDSPEHVPVAKFEEHKRRYGAGVCAEPLECEECSAATVPKPWRSALAVRSVRRAIMSFIAKGILDRFAESTFPGALYVSGLDGVVRRATSGSGPEICAEHEAVASVGEGDLAVSYWSEVFKDKRTIVRVLDSDQVPILQLRAHLGGRQEKLFVWLVSPGPREEHEYAMMPAEARTVINILDLNRAVQKTGLQVPEFCFHVICQKTDFVEKIVSQLGVSDTMKALEKIPNVGVSINASAASFDAVKVKNAFTRVAANSSRKRARLRDNEDVEFRRAWWVLLYWSYGWSGTLPASLTPKPAFGFDDNGARILEKIQDPYPVYTTLSNLNS